MAASYAGSNNAPTGMGVKKSHLYVSSNFSDQKKELYFKLVRPFRKNVATLSRFLENAGLGAETAKCCH